MPNNNNRINFQVGYNVDQSSVNAVKKSLQDLQNIKLKDFSGTKQDLENIKQVAGQVQTALNKAFNVNLNSLNTQKFNSQLASSKLTIDGIYQSFSKAGAQGQVAFSRMASSVLTTNMQLKQTNSLISSMGQTMANTVKWGVASSVMNNFTNSVQQAFQYVKSLDSALTDIRIVTGDSTEQMRSFAQEANNAAQSLGRSTMDYTKAALTFYQQGLSEEDVQARTESVLKAQNITGAGQEMADYLTAVWNGYKVANEEAELYVDKLAAVADSSASNMSQLAVAMSKVASTANTMGVDVDQLNAQIATIVATTRQAPESVGNALKTVYTRINDIATGADDAQISLGNYSKKMAEVGINVLDTNGRLRDTGQVIEEVGSKWAGMSKEQQVYLARTMAGQRQINNMTALFDNWSKYTDLVNVSLDAQGTTMEKNERYMDSLGAKMEQFGAAGERVKDALINEEDLKGIVDFGTSAVDLFANLVESIGGGGNALLTFGSIFTQLFSGTIAKQLNNVVTNIQNVKNNAQILKNDITSTELFGASQGYSEGVIKEMVDAKREMQQYYSVMSNQQINSYNNIIKEVAASKEEVTILSQQVQQAQRFAKALQEASIKEGQTGDLQNQIVLVNQQAEELKATLDSLKGKNALQIFNDGDQDIFGSIIDQVDALKKSVGQDAVIAFKDFDNAVQQVMSASQIGANQLSIFRNAAQKVFNQVYTGNNLVLGLDETKAKLEEANAALELSKQKIEEYKKSIEQFSNVKNIVDTASALGRLASGLNSLANLKNIWSNQNLSAGQKLLQTITNLGMAIPMLVTAYQTLQKTSLALSNTMINQSAIQQAMTKVEQADLAVKQTKTLIEQAEKAAKQGNAAATSSLIWLRQEEAVVTEQAAIAQTELNVAMEANPIGAIILGVTAAIAAITGLVTIYDKLHMSLNEATQATQTFKEKQKQLSSNTQSYQQNTSQLEDMREEYEELARKAGASTFDSMIDSLTEAERSRYNQIKNLIVSYNEDALAGYNDQGQAILTNNGYLEDTIQLLKEKHQAEIDSFVNSDEFRDANKADDVLYQDAQKRRDQAIEKKSSYTTNQDYSNVFARAFDITSLATNSQTFEQQINKLVAIQQDGIEKLDSHRAELDEIKNSILQKAAQTGQYAIQGQSDSFKAAIQQIQALGKEYQDSDFEIDNLEKQVEQKSRIAIDKLLIGLQATGSNEEYNALAEVYGQSMLNSIISSYSKGLSREDFTFDEAISNIRQNLLQSLKKINLSEGDISGFQDQFETLLGNIDWDNTTANQYASSVDRLIEKIYKENSKLQQLAKQNPEIVEELFQSMFGLDNIDIDFDKDGKITAKIQDQYTKFATDAKKMVQNLDVGDFKLPLSLEGLEDKKDILKDWIDTADLQTLGNFDHLLAQTDLSASDLAKALDEAKIKIQNLANAYSNADTLDLLGKSIAGQIDDQEIETLKTGLESLKDQYGNLTGAVQILNQTWLSGTTAYEKAYEDVKNTVFASFSEIGEYTDQVKQKLSDFAVKLEDLQRISVTNPELIEGDPEWYAQQLEKIASGYQSCADQLNRYILARQQGNQIQEQAARYDLQLAARAEQNSRAYDIQAQRISEVAKRFAEMGQAGEAGYEGLEENAQLAADAATRYIRLNDAIVDLYDNFDKYKQVLEEASQYGTESIRANEDLNQTFTNLKQSVADILDTSTDLLGDDWIVDNMQNILEAAQGNEQAIAALQESASEEILLNMGVDLSALDTSAEQVAEWAASLPEGELSVDDTQFVQQLVWAMQQAGYAQAAIQSALSGMHLDVDLEPMAQSLSQIPQIAGAAADAAAQNMGLDAETVTQPSQSTDQSQSTGWEATPHPVTVWGHVPIISADGAGNVSLTNIPTTTLAYGFSYTPEQQTSTDVKQTTATALKVKSARKSSGGNIAHINKPSVRNSGGSGGGGGKKGGKKPKSGSTAKPTTVSSAKASDAKKPVTDKSDPYHDINIQLDKQQRSLKKIQNQQKKLTGQKRLENLQKQNKELQKQGDLLDQKIAIANHQLITTRNELVADLGKGITFNSNGQIGNYNDALQNALDNYNNAINVRNDAVRKAEEDYNDYVEKYNKKSKDWQDKHKADLQKQKDIMQQAKKAADDTLESEKEKYDRIKDNIKAYDDTLDLINDLKDQQEEITQQIRDNIIAISQIKVDLSLDVGDLERQWIDFENKFIKKINKDDLFASAKASARQLMSYFDSEQIASVNDQIQNLNKEIAIIQAGGQGDVYGDRLTQAQARLDDLLKQQMDSLENIQDLIDEIKDTYLDALDDAKDKMDDQIDQYERVNDLINHNVKLTQLLYGDKAYGTMQKYYNLQKANNDAELQNLKTQQDYWQRIMNSFIDQNGQIIDQKAFEKAKDNFDDLTDQVNSKLEDMIQNLSDQWENRVDGIIAKLNNALTGGRGLDYLDEQWDYINDFDDNFLDTFESRMGIQEVTNLYQQAIDGLSGSPANQQKINKLMNDQLKILREKDNLTQYDIDRAKAALQVQKARMALEDSRYNKTKMRLRRDSQGNYTYQYVADEQKLGDLQSALADAQANLYNMDKEHYTQNLNNLYDAYRDYLDKMRDLTEEYNKTQDAAERARIQNRIDLLRQSSSQLMDGLLEDNDFAQKYLNQSWFGGIGIDASVYSTEEQMQILRQNVPQMQSNIQDLADTIVGQGGIINATADAIKQINKATLDYDNNVQEVLNNAGTSLENITKVTDEFGNALDVNIQQVQNLIPKYTELINTSVNAIASIKDLMDRTNESLDGLISDETLENLGQAYNLLQKVNEVGNWFSTDSLLKGENGSLISSEARDWGLDKAKAQDYTQYIAVNSTPVDFSNALSPSVVSAIENINLSNLSDVDAESLSAVLQYITNSMDAVASNQIASISSGANGYIGNINNVEHLDQNVHIEANFPNVTQHTEIEQAFNNLVNIASMRASNYRD